MTPGLDIGARLARGNGGYRSAIKGGSLVTVTEWIAGTVAGIASGVERISIHQRPDSDRLM